jgi:nucleoid-associated protein YgaU
MYTVKKGDTLWAIAEAHYGKGQGAKYTEIVKANSPPVKNPDLIQPGWVLRIPTTK